MTAGLSRADSPDVPSATRTRPGTRTDTSTDARTVTRSDTRTGILAAAMSILQRQGAGAMTVRSVAAAAGCSTTGVYTWFGGKGGLVEAIFIDGFRSFGEAIRAAQRTAPASQPLAGLPEAYRSWALANPTQYMVMFGRAVPDYVPSDDARSVATSTFDDLVTSTSATMSTIELVGTPADIAYHLWAGIHGYVSLELAGMDMADNEDERAERFELGLQRLLRDLLG